MTIEAELYVIGNGNQWRSKGTNTANLSTGILNHAERKLYTEKRNVADNLVLIVQNAYPCTDCHNFFLEKSKNGVNIIIKVTDDQGSYGAEHGFELNKAPKTAIFYYRQGTHKIVTMTSTDRNPPLGFPDVPDFVDK